MAESESSNSSNSLRTSKISESRESDYFTDEPDPKDVKGQIPFDSVPQKPLATKKVEETVENRGTPYKSQITDHETITDADLAEHFNVLNDGRAISCREATENHLLSVPNTDQSPNLVSQLTHITNPYEAEEQDDVCSKIIIWMFGACSRCKCCKKCVEKLFGQEDPDESFVSQLYSEGSSDEENEE